eukprot:4368088-Amphidinium_carterae.2
MADAWVNALADGHRQVQTADRLLRRSWIFPVPLPIVGAPGEAQSEAQSTDAAGARHCELVIVAVFWSPGTQPDDPPSGMLIAVPEVVAHGVENVTYLSTSTFYSDGTFVETVRVALLLANPAYVGQHLSESCPADSTLVSFLENNVGAALDLPESALQGYWLHVAEGDQPSLRMLVDGGATDEDFVSAGLPDTDDPQVLVTEIVGAATTTRRMSPGRSRRPSVLGLGSSAKALGSFLARPPQTKAAGQGKPKPALKPKAVFKGASPVGTDREILHQVLLGVQSLGDRVAALESPVPTSQVPMPLPMSALSVPQPSSSISMPQQSSSMSVPQQSSLMSMHQQSSPFMPTSQMPMPMASSPALCAASPFAPGLQNVTLPGAVPKGPPSLLAPQVGSVSVPYSDAMAEARRLLAVPPLAEQETGGRPRGARERQVDLDIRSAVMQGGADAQTAVNLALVEALERISGKGSGETDDVFAEFLGGDGSSSDSDRKARGSEQLLKLAKAIERSPDRFSAQLDMAAAKACGAFHTNLPWTMEMYGERNIRFGRLEGHERLFAMLAHLHGLARAGQGPLMAARVGQFLKATELSIQCGGSWKLAWVLTGLPEVRSHSANMLGRGLAMPAEYAATVSYMKDMATLETAIQKSDDTPGGHGVPGASSSSSPPPPSSGTQQSSQPKGRGQGGARPGRQGQGRAKPKPEPPNDPK